MHLSFYYIDHNYLMKVIFTIFQIVYLIVPPPDHHQGARDYFILNVPLTKTYKNKIMRLYQEKKKKKIWIFKSALHPSFIIFFYCHCCIYCEFWQYLFLPETPIYNFLNLFCFKQEIFINLSIVEKNYFVCNVDDFKFLADMIQHVPLHLRARYVFCCAPINRKLPFICTMFLKVPLLLPICELLILKTLYSFWTEVFICHCINLYFKNWKFRYQFV